MKLELSDEDIQYIQEIFFRDVVPKLKRAQARRGTISCEFAGARYEHWSLRFASRGSDFDIEEFEYDEGSRDINLDL